jgi:hypothetical protein
MSLTPALDHLPPDVLDDGAHDPHACTEMESPLAGMDDRPQKPFEMTPKVRFSILVGVLVLCTYACVAIFGANMIIKLEKDRFARDKDRFHQVEVTQPISGFDTTYLKKGNS